jgi:hypothetical protein
MVAARGGGSFECDQVEGVASVLGKGLVVDDDEALASVEDLTDLIGIDDLQSVDTVAAVKPHSFYAAVHF